MQGVVEYLLHDPSIYEEEEQRPKPRPEMEIKLHTHTLRFWENMDTIGGICLACLRPLSGQGYGCGHCQFFLHKSCAELPPTIQHFTHPCPLHLRISATSVCSACDKESLGFTYYCGRCEFNLDLECAWLPSGSLTVGVGAGGEDEELLLVSHFCHRHQLTVFNKLEDTETRCFLCDKFCSGNTCGCYQCKFYLHKSCMDFLPLQVRASLHSCILVLLTAPSYTCSSCYKTGKGLTFRCNKCYYHLCIRCFLTKATTMSERYLKSPREIQPFSHPCPLTMRNLSFFLCNICLKHCSGISYHCDLCEFDVDTDCAKLFLSKQNGENGKKVQHFCHHHLLDILEKIKDPEVRCEVCQQLCSGPSCCCAQCKFFVHKSCMDVLSQTTQIPLHPCPLVLLTTLTYLCGACEKRCSGLTYRCGKCYFHLCVYCALAYTIRSRGNFEVKQHIKLFFHPCVLTLKISASFSCRACHTLHSGFGYHCQVCDFYLDIECTQLLKSEHRDGQIQHLCHRHPLTVYGNMEDHAVSCEICRKTCKGPSVAYGCSGCEFYVHQYCLDNFPPKVDHSFHPCPLIPLTVLTFGCDGCDEEFSGLIFFCGKCSFKLCVECALLPRIQSADHEKIQHCLHEHPLTLGDMVTHVASCYGCGGNCFGPVYSCRRCNMFLHRSCAELLQEIPRNPFHPWHSLTLLKPEVLSSRSVLCNLCHGKCNQFALTCKKCDFGLDIECGSLFPTIKYDGHPHLLTIVENIQDEQLTCNACDLSCFSMPAMRCLRCNFNLHLSCGPLPCQIKHKCHVHPLILKDFYAEDDDNDDDFYCYACEEARNPKECVYFCALGCLMVVEMKCALSAIIPSLKGEYGDLELRTVGGQIAGKVVSKHVIANEMKHHGATLEAWEDEDKKRLATPSEEDIFKYFEVLFQEEEEDSDETKGENAFAYSEEAFTRFMDKFDAFAVEDKLPDITLQHDEVAAVDGYSIPRTLAPTLQDLLAKYGDVSSDAMLHTKEKSAYYSLLCFILRSMRETKVVELTEEALFEWLEGLKVVELAGFRIGFLFDHMKLLQRAYFGIQSRKFVEGIPHDQELEISRISEEQVVLRDKLEANARKIQELKKSQQAHKKHVKCATTSLLKQCLEEGAVMKWKPASHTLL